MDSTPSASATYYYKIATIDSSGNASVMSATSTGVANGIQDGSEGGGGTSSTAPTISSVSSSNTTTSIVSGKLDDRHPFQIPLSAIVFHLVPITPPIKQRFLLM